MAKGRAFSDDNIRKKADDYHGRGGYLRTVPDMVSQGIKSINIEMTFEEAMKLGLGIQACLMQLNRYNRSTTAGREMGLVLSVKTDTNSITVIEKPVHS